MSVGGTNRSSASPTSVGPSARDLLIHVYHAAGPYLTVMTPCGELAETHPSETFAQHRPDLEALGAHRRALDAVAARLALPTPSDAGGQIVIAAADGTTAADYGSEAPEIQTASVDSLPYAAPLLEWEQWRVPHMVVLTRGFAGDIVVFAPGEHGMPHEVSMADPHDDGLNFDAIVAACRGLALAHDVRLVAIAGDPSSRGAVADRLADALPVTALVRTLESSPEADTLGDEVVRLVADHVARATVDVLREFRFLLMNGLAAQGAEATLVALASGAAGRLIVHDAPEDPRRAFWASDPRAVSIEQTGAMSSGRLVDVAIRSALLQQMEVRIVPSTGDTGPAENIGFLFVDPPSSSHAISDAG